MGSKKWYTSWTLWFNLLSGLALTVGGWMGQLPELEKYAAPVLAVGNFLLRFKTDKPVGG